MAAGADPAPWIGEADAILVIDALAPWSPDIHQPKPDCRIIQHRRGPAVCTRFPVRNFRADMSIAGEPARSFWRSRSAMAGHAARRGQDAGAARGSASSTRIARDREKTRCRSAPPAAARR